MSLPSPKSIHQQLPLTKDDALSIQRWRQTISDILTGKDPRKLLIIGPCALHCVQSTLEYAHLLLPYCLKNFFVVMRAYTEKSRTGNGWRGFLYSHQSLHSGIIETRKLLIQLIRLGLPLATEFVSPLFAPYISDLIAWGAIGARTVQSPVHRELASQLPMPIGIKNGTDGSVDAAIQAMAIANRPTTALSINDKGQIEQKQTKGNPYAHLVLRGGYDGPNYQRHEQARNILQESQLLDAIIIDCSHGNSQYQWEEQEKIFTKALTLPIKGIMLESFLLDSSQQDLLSLITNNDEKEKILYGSSRVDGCLGWAKTEQLLRMLM